MTALLTDEEIREAARQFANEVLGSYEDYRISFLAGANHARDFYEARLAEAISLMKEAAPAIDTISSGLSERFDRFLAVHAKEDKP